MAPQTKIYIIGPSGSGKSFLAKKLSFAHPLCKGDRNLSPRKFQGILKKQLPILDLDDIFWETKYIQEHTPTKKQELLQKFIQNNPNSWVIEGAPQKFLKPVSKQATKIIWLNPNTTTLLYRVLKRFIKNKKNNQAETWYGLYWLIKGVISYKLKNDLYRQHKNTFTNRPK